MNRPRPLSHAPISEALIDIRVRARRDFSPDEFDDLPPLLASEFPHAGLLRSQQTSFEVNFHEGQATASAQPKRLLGHIFKSQDEKTIAQFRVDGFTLNRLAPYSSWNEIFPVAMRLWGTYVGVAEPEVVTRLALRYINRIDVLKNLTNVGEILTAPPMIPDGLPPHLSDFLTRLVIHDLDRGLVANVIQARLQGQTPAILLDIDAYQQQEHDPAGADIRETFQALREFKNRVFFCSLTEPVLKGLE